MKQFYKKMHEELKIEEALYWFNHTKMSLPECAFAAACFTALFCIPIFL